MKKTEAAVRIAAYVLALLILPGRATGKIDAFFTPSDDVRPVILDHLAAASESLDVAMYSFSEKSLMDAVKAAARRGVKTRLLLHDADTHASKVEELESAGVDVRHVNLIMHHKFAVIDGQHSAQPAPRAVLLTGSGNWSTSMSKDFDEDFLVVRNEPDIILSFQSEFDYLWGHAREAGFSIFPGASATGFSSSRTVFTSENMETFTYRGEPSFRVTVEGDSGVAGNTIKEKIETAESSIDIATTHFRRPDIYKALTAAHARGVRIRMLLDGQEFEPDARDDGSNTHFDELLSTQGADVRYKTYSRYWFYPTAKQMHTKYMIVDGKTLVTGTFNWSYNAEINTFENLLILSDIEIVGSYEENFSAMFQKDPAGLTSLREELTASRGHSPCHFSPLPLSPEELKDLYSRYQRGACWGGE